MFNLSIGRLRQMLRKEMIQLVRDPKMRIMVLFIPVFTLLLCGYAMDVNLVNTPLAVVDNDRSAESRELLERFSGTGIFHLKDLRGSMKALEDLIDDGGAEAGLVIPQGYDAAVRSGRGAKLLLVIDGTKVIDAANIAQAATRIVTELDLYRARRPMPLSAELRALYNPNFGGTITYLPGLIGVLLLMQSLTVAGLSIVREKEIGTIEQVMVTPIGRMEFILGKTLPYMLVGYVVLAMTVAGGMIFFQMPFRGSAAGFILLSGLFMAGNLGLALTISNESSTQKEALLTSFFLLMPMTLLSGFVFPIRNMPQAVQWCTLLNPLTWYVEGARMVLLKGAALRDLGRHMAALSALSAAYCAFAVFKFKKKSS